MQSQMPLGLCDRCSALCKIIPVWHLEKHLGSQSKNSCRPSRSLPCPPALTLTMVETNSNTSTATWRNRIPNNSRSMVTGSWARAWWSGACTEKEAGVRPVALARGSSWPGGGSSRHPYPRPASARDPTSFAFGTKQASGTHVSITPGGARRRGVSRRMSRGHSKPPPSRGASWGSWDSGGHRGYVPARVTGRIPPRAGGSTGGARIVVSGLGSPAA